MSIIRIAKRERWTSISNGMLEDSAISLKAKGLLCYLLSKPDDWTISLVQLSHISHKDGIVAIRSALDELVKHGYAVFSQPRENGQFAEGGWTISEIPCNVFPYTENSFMQNTPTSNTSTCNGTLLITEREPKTEKKETPSLNTTYLEPPPAKSNAKRSRFCPPDYQPSSGIYALGLELGMDAGAVDTCLENMRDHEFQSPKSDWNRTMRKWLRTEAKIHMSHYGPRGPSTSAPAYRDAKQQRTFEASMRLMEELDSDKNGHDEQTDPRRISGWLE